MELKPKEYRFQTRVRWQGSGCDGALSAPDCPDVDVGCPPEFGEPEGRDPRARTGRDTRRWTPEHLLVAAAETCLMATFTDMARRRKLDLRAFESRATGLLTVVDGRFRFAKVEIWARISTELKRDRGRAEALLREAAERCPVSATLRCPTEIHIE